jgi:hypothetical protein
MPREPYSGVWARAGAAIEPTVSVKISARTIARGWIVGCCRGVRMAGMDSGFWVQVTPRRARRKSAQGSPLRPVGRDASL